jgi:hypothetical protein
MLALSSAELRWSPRHARDDYRSASAIALKALEAGRNVWWSADPVAAAYYGLPFAKKGGDGRVAQLRISHSGREAVLPLPDMIVTSKWDVFDPEGELGRVIRTQHYRPTHRLKAITVWER